MVIGLSFQVWRTSTSEFVRTLHGHRRGIACLQYRGNHVVSGSSDNTIRIWDIECGACLRMLEGHDDLVRYSERERERREWGGREREGGRKEWESNIYPLTMFLSFTLIGVSGLMTKGLSVEHMTGRWYVSCIS